MAETAEFCGCDGVMAKIECVSKFPNRNNGAIPFKTLHSENLAPNLCGIPAPTGPNQRQSRYRAAQRAVSFGLARG
jgi:hypothetical protein